MNNLKITYYSYTLNSYRIYLYMLWDKILIVLFSDLFILCTFTCKLSVWHDAVTSSTYNSFLWVHLSSWAVFQNKSASLLSDRRGDYQDLSIWLDSNKIGTLMNYYNRQSPLRVFCIFLSSCQPPRALYCLFYPRKFSVLDEHLTVTALYLLGESKNAKELAA